MEIRLGEPGEFAAKGRDLVVIGLLKISHRFPDEPCSIEPEQNAQESVGVDIGAGIKEISAFSDQYGEYDFDPDQQGKKDDDKEQRQQSVTLPGAQDDRGSDGEPEHIRAGAEDIGENSLAQRTGGGFRDLYLRSLKGHTFIADVYQVECAQDGNYAQQQIQLRQA